MTTRLPTRENLTTLLEAVKAEPEGPDRSAAIEQLEAQLGALDDPDALVGPDADLAEPDLVEEQASRPASPTDKADNKPF